ncbi:hypothetical protein [Aneurinibacillus tyrosinisolvens]|uniref:hypothetical protein n=1 Tax=Aneurinibacillus tyrosinisolvens TaxID=1443435 RepID=UPI00063F3D56|nr:hypothetical protein [Aneurinibacillus tyrosinisolvens]
MRLGYCSKEWSKHHFELPNGVDLTKLLTEELYGLYLAGIISERRFKEILGIDENEFDDMTKKVFETMEQYVPKRDDDIEIEFW